MLIWKVIEIVLFADFYLLFFSVWQKRSFAPSTPLTGRRYLREKETAITPVASATQSVSRLQSMVAGLKNAPSEQLTAIFEWVCPLQLLSLTRKLIFWLFFLWGRIFWSVFLYYFLLKDLLFSRCSHLEKDGWTHTPPPLTCHHHYVNGGSAFADLDLSECLKAKCLFYLFTF